MLALIKNLHRFILATVIVFTALFQTGLPRVVDMPDTQPGEYGQWVDPFIGTGGLPWVSGMLFPGATTPFGMVRLSPDTAWPGGIHPFTCGTAGYYYGHDHLWGFSHTRLSGTGVEDMGHFRVTPAVGNFDPADRRSKPLVFSHDQETSTAGYYAVNLPGIDCLAELTATQHTGAHRYTFRSAKDAHLFIDATSFLADGRAEEGKSTSFPKPVKSKAKPSFSPASRDDTTGSKGISSRGLTRPSRRTRPGAKVSASREEPKPPAMTRARTSISAT